MKPGFGFSVNIVVIASFKEINARQQYFILKEIGVFLIIIVFLHVFLLKSFHSMISM